MANYQASALSLFGQRHRPPLRLAIVKKDPHPPQSKPPGKLLVIASKLLSRLPAPTGKHPGTGMLKLLEK